MKKIAIIGASDLQLPLIEKAKQMGLFTICFAWEEGAVCRDYCDKFYPISILEKEEILGICKLEKIDAIVSIASDAAVPTVCYVAENLGLISNPYEYSNIFTNKFAMRCEFKNFGVNIPWFYLINKDSRIDENRISFPLIVKPVDRSGSRGVHKVNNIDEIELAIGNAQFESFSNCAIIENYITGCEVSVESISWKGEHYILSITDKVTTGNPHFVEIEHHQPSQLEINIQENIKEETIRALYALKIQYGASHTELKITDDGKIFVIEVGARMGGDYIGSDLVELSTGYDYLKGIIEISLGYFSTPKILFQKYSGVYFLSKDTNHLLKQFDGPIKDYVIKSKLFNKELINVSNSTDRSGYFIYQSNLKINFCK
jgi:biotin carboxylase